MFGLGIDTLLLALISFITFFVCMQIEKKTTIPGPIIYLLIGIPLGVNFLNVMNVDVFPSIKVYQKYLLFIMFFGAGFGIDFKTLKETGKTTFKLSSIPVLVETVLMTFVARLIINNMTPWNIGLLESLMMCMLFAMASPANVVPLTNAHIREGRLGNSNSASTMVSTSVLDNFLPMPLLLVASAMVAGPAFGFGTDPVAITIKSVVYAVGFIAGGFILGFITSKLLSPLSKWFEQNQTKKNGIIVTVVYLVLLFVVYLVLGKTSFAALLGLFFINTCVFMGTGIGNTDRVASKPVAYNSMVIFNMFGLPIVFMDIAASIDFTILSELKLVVATLLFILASIVIKSLFAVLSCRGAGYEKSDIKYIISAFIPKGKTLVNFALILGGILGTTADIILSMNFIAVIGMLITMPLGISLMSLKGKTWLATK